MELGRVADLAEEAVEDAAALDELFADDLEDLQTAHHLVLGEVDDAHAALAELADDFVVGMIDQARRQAAGRWRRRRARRGIQHRESFRAGDGGVERLGRGLRFSEAAEKAIGGERGDALPAFQAALEVLVDRLGRGVVDLAQAVGVQDLVSRMGNLRGVHGIGLRVESGRTPCAASQWITRALVTRRNVRSEEVHHRGTENTEKNQKNFWSAMRDDLAPTEPPWPFLFLRAFRSAL